MNIAYLNNQEFSEFNIKLVDEYDNPILMNDANW